jgi:hypothetical protein
VSARVLDSYITVLAFNKIFLPLLYGYWIVRNVKDVLRAEIHYSLDQKAMREFCSLYCVLEKMVLFRTK